MRRLMMISLLATLPACAARKPVLVEQKEPSPACPAPASAGQPLPVTSVALFTGGTAYIEHKGTVQDNPTLELRFKGGQVAGVLRSMVVQDESFSGLATIQPLESPTTEAAAEDHLDLSANPTLVDMLQQLRGAKVQIQNGGAAQEVTILSLEKREKEKGGGETWQLNVLEGGAIRAVPMESISKIQLSDERAQQEINRSLESLWQTADQPRRVVAIHLRGGGQRPVRISYALEAEPWKISYRLTVSDKSTLQAWASVTNDTSSDWNKVQLNLMSASPVILGQGGAIDATTVGRAARSAGVPAGDSLRRAKPIPTRQALDNDSPATTEPPRRSPPPADGPLVNPREVFRYSVADVTIPRRGTVVVPILSDAIAVEPVAVFNESLLRRNPLQGARIRNTTRHYLLQGSVAVVDDGDYAGDATLENLAPGRFCLVTWGVDLPIQIDASHETFTAGIKSVLIDKGLLTVSRSNVYTKEYLAENEGQKDRTLIIEHPIRRGWSLVDSTLPLDTTENLYRFQLKLPAGKQTPFIVKEQTAEAEVIDLATADIQTVQSLSRNTQVSAEIRDALAKLVTLKQQILDQERQSKPAEPDPTKVRDDNAPPAEPDAMGNDAADVTPPARKSRRDSKKPTPAIPAISPEVDKARKEMEDFVGKLNIGKRPE